MEHPVIPAGLQRGRQSGSGLSRPRSTPVRVGFEQESSHSTLDPPAGIIVVVTLPAPCRWILAVAVTIGLQLCCCDLEAMFRACMACGDHSAPAAADHAHDHDEPAGAHHSHDHSTASEDQRDPSPCDDHHEQGECTCESHEMAKSLPQKPQVELPVVTLMAVLPAPAYNDVAREQRVYRKAPNEGGFRPPTSLLRLHCALTI